MRTLTALLSLAMSLTPATLYIGDAPSCGQTTSFGATFLEVRVTCNTDADRSEILASSASPPGPASTGSPAASRVLLAAWAGICVGGLAGGNALASCTPTEPTAPAPAPNEPAAAPLTIADLAAFRPAVGELITQPDGWGAAGRPTNFIATATDHIQEGTLLGEPVRVRWRPVSFTFEYGDGSAQTSPTGGAIWPTTEAEWTTTATSHTYESRGPVVASVTVEFAADVARVDADAWSTVQGTLPVSTGPANLHIYEIHTVLTRGTCKEYPDDPGCP